METLIIRQYVKISSLNIQHYFDGQVLFCFDWLFLNTESSISFWSQTYDHKSGQQAFLKQHSPRDVCLYSCLLPVYFSCRHWINHSKNFLHISLASLFQWGLDMASYTPLGFCCCLTFGFISSYSTLLRD